MFTVVPAAAVPVNFGNVTFVMLSAFDVPLSEAASRSGALGGARPPPTLLTVTETAADVTLLPAVSRATAVKVCEPFAAVVVSQLIEYGELVSSLCRDAPSSLNCTPYTPEASVVAVIVVMPETLLPFAGAV